jgi:hypothetical protein
MHEEKAVEFKVSAEDRIKIFSKKLDELQITYGVKLYAAQQVTEQGEIITIIKVMDVVPVEEHLQANKKDVDTTKSGNIVSK